MIDYNKFKKEVHQNAKDHGWWDDPRSIDEIICLIHSEWSEALEEYRCNKPIVYCNQSDASNAACVTAGQHICATVCGFRNGDAKPEGFATEIVDGMIRILDYFGHEGYGMRYDAEHSASHCETVPALICTLHSMCADAWHGIKIYKDDGELRSLNVLEMAFWTAYAWLDSHDVDVDLIMQKKHEFNKSRPYKHGGKKI